MITVARLQDEARARLTDLVKQEELDGFVLLVFKEAERGVVGVMACAGYRGVKSYELLPIAKAQIEHALQQLNSGESPPSSVS